MMTSRIYCFVAAVLFVAGGMNVARGQISVDEANRRLQEKLTTRPATQPATELDKLRNENLHLRERVMSLELEVTTLKGALARASASAAAAGPTTRPAEEAKVDPNEALQKPVVGNWRGGDINAGAGFLLTFKADGTYNQLFIATSQHETGQFRVFSDGTMEMWNSKWPDTKKHNQYKFAATAVQLTLTPMVIDGNEVKTPKALVLGKVE